MGKLEGGDSQVGDLQEIVMYGVLERPTRLCAKRSTKHS